MNFYKEVKSSEASKVFVFSHSVVSDSLPPHGLQPTRLLCPWDSSGKNTRVGSHFLLQQIFPTQGSNTALPHCRGVLYQLNHRGSPGKSLLGRKEGVWMGTGAVVSVTEARPCGGLGHLVGCFFRISSGKSSVLPAMLHTWFISGSPPAPCACTQLSAKVGSREEAYGELTSLPF